jgi:hypothetical protein
MGVDPAVTQALMLVGVMVAIVVAIYVTRRSRPASPPLELSFPNAAWGPALEVGERIETQVPVLQPVSWWWRQVFNGPFAAWNTPRQLALTSGGALLVAERGTGNLSDRRRYQLSDVRIENVKNQDEYHVSFRLLLPHGRMNIQQVPRTFVEQLRSRGVEVAVSAAG